MTIPIQKFRELVFQMLYSHTMGVTNEKALCSLLVQQLSVTKKDAQAALERVNLVKEKIDQIDALIAETSDAYDFERIHSVERNVLRLGVYEMFFDDEIPPKVAIVEGIRLSKKFGAPESTSYVNAILDHLYKKYPEGVE